MVKAVFFKSQDISWVRGLGGGLAGVLLLQVLEEIFSVPPAPGMAMWQCLEGKHVLPPWSCRRLREGRLVPQPAKGLGVPCRRGWGCRGVLCAHRAGATRNQKQ